MCKEINVSRYRVARAGVASSLAKVDRRTSRDGPNCPRTRRRDRAASGSARSRTWGDHRK